MLNVGELLINDLNNFTFEFGCLQPWTVILVSHQMLGANLLVLFATLPFTDWMNFGS